MDILGSKKKLRGLKVALLRKNVIIHKILEIIMIIDTLFIWLGKEKGTKFVLIGPRRGSGGKRWLINESYFPLANINL